jgi:hypothetical protein
VGVVERRTMIWTKTAFSGNRNWIFGIVALDLYNTFKKITKQNPNPKFVQQEAKSMQIF